MRALNFEKPFKRVRTVENSQREDQTVVAATYTMWRGKRVFITVFYGQFRDFENWLLNRLPLIQVRL